jgi:hypothetical protein
MADLTVESVVDKIKELVTCESDQAYTLGMAGGDDFTEEERARYKAAPTIEQIQRDIETLAGVHMEPWDA